MSIEGVEILVNSALNLEQRIDPDQGPLPRVELALRSYSNFGLNNLRQLLSFLKIQNEYSVFLGFYTFSNDRRIHKLFTSQMTRRICLIPDTELDWLVWECPNSIFQTLDEEQLWPDLVVPASLAWLIWTIDNDSYLYLPNSK